MNGISLFYDTTIMVYLLEGAKKITELLQGSEIKISFITERELLSKENLSSSEKNKIQTFIVDLKLPLITANQRLEKAQGLNSIIIT